MRWRASRGWVVLVVGVLMSCASESPPIVFDSVAVEPTEQSEALAPPVPSIPIAAQSDPLDRTESRWRDATGNLAGLRSECGNVNHVAARDDGTMITAVALAGLWQSHDVGQSWEELATAEGSTEMGIRLTSVLFDPEDSNRWWITGVYNSGGVYETSDDGATFHQLGPIFDPVALSIDFDDPERQLLVAVNQDDVGVSRSIDGGATWASIADGLPTQGGRTTGVAVIDETTHLVGISDGSVPGIFRTIDGGATWVRDHPGGVTGQPITTQDGEILWLLARGRGVASSADSGATWTESLGRGISPFASNLIELPDRTLVTFGSSNLLASPDGGATWRSFGPPLPFEPTGIAYVPGEGGHYVAWRYSCELDGNNAVRPGTIMRFDRSTTASTGADTTPSLPNPNDTSATSG